MNKKEKICSYAITEIETAMKKHKKYVEDELQNAKEKYGEDSSEYLECLHKLVGFWETITALNTSLGCHILHNYKK